MLKIYTNALSNYKACESFFLGLPDLAIINIMQLQSPSIEVDFKGHVNPMGI